MKVSGFAGVLGLGTGGTGTRRVGAPETAGLRLQHGCETPTRHPGHGQGHGAFSLAKDEEGPAGPLCPVSPASPSDEQGCPFPPGEPGDALGGTSSALAAQTLRWQKWLRALATSHPAAPATAAWDRRAHGRGNEPVSKNFVVLKESKSPRPRGAAAPGCPFPFLLFFLFFLIFFHLDHSDSKMEPVPPTSPVTGSFCLPQPAAPAQR